MESPQVSSVVSALKKKKTTNFKTEFNQNENNFNDAPFSSGDHLPRVPFWSVDFWKFAHQLFCVKFDLEVCTSYLVSNLIWWRFQISLIWCQGCIWCQFSSCCFRRFSSEAGCLVVSREICFIWFVQIHINEQRNMFYLICTNTHKWEACKFYDNLCPFISNAPHRDFHPIQSNPYPSIHPLIVSYSSGAGKPIYMRNGK